MLNLKFTVTTLIACLFACFPTAIISSAGQPESSEEVILLGKFSKNDLNRIMETASKKEDPGEQVDLISRNFLGTGYQASTLTGSHKKKEILVINLKGMDCFTYLDYVEAMRLSGDFSEFKKNLVHVRYRDSRIDYANRNHFFSDWSEYNNVVDVTRQVAGTEYKTTVKMLNRKDEKEKYLPRIDVIERSIGYIPSGKLNNIDTGKIKTGDYLGIYTTRPGLDVSHTGIATRKSGKLYIRHASSSEKNAKVVEELLAEYLMDKPGLVILRPVVPEK